MNHWSIIKKQAEKFFSSDTEWSSFIEKRKYKLRLVEDDRIIIARLSGGNDETFRRDAVDNAIENLKTLGRLKKGELYPIVASETALIYLHPSIYWDDFNKQIFWDDSSQDVSLNNTTIFIEQASDDELEKINIEVNKRKNQNKFKESLLKAYNSCCAISQINLPEVLQGAHILAHSINGVNNLENGILLRSDLHILFDRNLLLIHPINLTVHLNPILQNTIYWEYDGITISKRIDNSRPSVHYLQEKWNLANWMSI